MTGTSDKPDTSPNTAAVARAEPLAVDAHRGNAALQRQQAVVAIGRKSVAPPVPSILMQDAAALLAETLETEYSAVAQLSPDGQSLIMTFSPRPTADKEPAALVHRVSAGGKHSLAGYVLEVAYPMVVTDLLKEDRFHDVFLRKQGIRSAVAVPLKLPNKSFGSLVVCDTNPRDFDEGDILFAETIAHLVATAVGREQAEEALAEERRFAAKVLQTVDAMVLVLDAQWQIVRINAACERITGFREAEVKDRPIGNVLPVAEEMDLFETLKEKLQAGTGPVEYESYLLTKHAQRRLISWSYSAISDSDGNVESIIATGVDITDQREATERATRAEEAVEEGQRALAKLMGYNLDDDDVDPELVDAFSRLPKPLNAERRGRARRSYPYRQKVAAIIEGKLPQRDMFVEVQCHDISSGGFSFLCDSPPATDTLVIALGAPPKTSYLIAQIAHITRTEAKGEGKFLVGCNYVGRAAY
ncbi:MAG: PAS domain S-box protein [Pirellulales bacterium]|nr:PAS domain S-box protein [Pirellulales bacterium]